MLSGLRHNTIVSCYHQHRRIDRAYASQHIINKICVTWHIDKTDCVAYGRAIVSGGKMVVGKSQINAQSTRLLLGQRVSVYPGYMLHQRGLAVVYMTGRGDNERPATWSAF